MFRSDNNTPRPPRWLCVLLVLMSLPLLGYPYLLITILNANVWVADNSTMRFLVYLLPFYIIGSQWITYRIYNERRTEAWILQVMLLMVYLCCIWLVFCS